MNPSDGFRTRDIHNSHFLTIFVSPSSPVDFVQAGTVTGNGSNGIDANKSKVDSVDHLEQPEALQDTVSG